MTAHAFKVGDSALHVERIHGFGKPSLILRVKIARETNTQWIDDSGTRWRKSDASKVPQYMTPRFLMTEAAFAAAGGVL